MNDAVAAMSAGRDIILINHSIEEQLIFLIIVNQQQNDISHCRGTNFTSSKVDRRLLYGAIQHLNTIHDLNVEIPRSSLFLSIRPDFLEGTERKQNTRIGNKLPVAPNHTQTIGRKSFFRLLYFLINSHHQYNQKSKALWVKYLSSLATVLVPIGSK